MKRGFSLVEVILAVAIVATAVVVSLSLLSVLGRRTGESADLRTAQRLTDLVALEMRRRAIETGFDSFASSIPMMSAPLLDGRAYVVSADAAQIAREDESTIAVSDQRYLIELWRFAQAPLQFDPNASILAVYVRVSWPYRMRGLDTPTRMSDRTSFTFTAAINR
jgi:prepilin-type N-terminal cleavage/methylation domain-containing protein